MESVVASLASLAQSIDGEGWGKFAIELVFLVGVVKATLNGLRDDVKEVKGDVREIRNQVVDNIDRIGQLEGGQGD